MGLWQWKAGPGMSMLLALTLLGVQIYGETGTQKALC